MRARAIIMRTHAIIMRAHAMTNACPRKDQCVSPKKLMRGHAIIMRGHVTNNNRPWYVVMAVGVIDESNTKNFFKQPCYDFTSTGLRVIQLEVVHQGAALLGDELLFTVWWDIDVIKIQVTKNISTNIAYLAIGLDKNT